MGQDELHAIEKNAAPQQLEDNMSRPYLQEREDTCTPLATQQTLVASYDISNLLPGLDLGLQVEQPASQEPLPHPRSDMLCVVCMEGEKKVVLLPCKHMCMCKVCAAEIIADSAQCPVCREHVADSFEAFF